MPLFKPQQKHKAQHGNYYKKPSKKEVTALMSMYAAMAEVTRIIPVKKTEGVQLKLEL